MDFGFGREGFSEEDQMGKAKLIPFSCSSSSSPSSSSSHHKSHLISLRWDHHQQQMGSNWLNPDDENDRTATTTNNNNEEPSSSRRRDSDSPQIEKEHMFDKIVTPSDVGKLNRLVIPKQYAERFFPLDSSTNEKGLLLSFEDRIGKQWKFRYSYWNSSQSYVMTKGWSRFVKEKKLDAGDVVSFQRGVGEVNRDRFFIDWRKRPDSNNHHRPSFHHPQQHLNFHQWSPMIMRPTQQVINRSSYYGNAVNNGVPRGAIGSFYYLGSGVAQAAALAPMEWQQQRGGGGVEEPIVFESVPVVQGKAAAKRLRLFGVNMDCPITESDDCEIISSTAIASVQPAAAPLHTLRLYNGTPLPHQSGKCSSSSLDLDI